MARIPVTVQTSQPVGSSNPAATTSRSVGPPNVRTLGPAQPRLQMRTFAENRAQSAANQAYRRAVARYDADQIVVPGVSFAPEVVTVVKHRLGRAFVGASLTNQRGAFVGFWIVPNTDSRLDAGQVQLWSLTACTADVVIW
jgi:hypothetical protein